MRVLVCGGRDFADRAAVARALSPYRPDNAATDASEHIIIVGGARGADALAEEWADVWGVRKRVYPADWKRDGKAAGPIRNQRMLDEGKPDLVIAFPGGVGTADMKRRARAKGVKVIEIEAA